MSPDAEEPRAAAVPDTTDATAPVPAAAKPSLGILWWMAGLTVVIDQATKLLISSTLPVYGSRTVVPHFLDIVHVHNAGVAFGLLNSLDDPRRGILSTALAVVALIGIAYYARHIGREERLARAGLSLILGGAVGNLIDRVRQGYVVDFVDVYWGDWHFWAFNAADAAISIGAGLVFIEVLFFNRHASHPV